MKTIRHFKVFAVFFVMAYLLAACGGTLPQAATSAKGPKVEANTIVAFTGTVEAIAGTEWTVNGQKLTLDPQARLDPNISVGDEVKVEASVSSDGAVMALKVERAVAEDGTPSAGAEVSSTPDPVDTPSPDVSSAPDGIVSSAEDTSISQAEDASANEVFGTVEAITTDTITVDGVTYNLTSATEIKDALTVGDTVKLHVTVNADGTMTVREIETSAASFDANDGPNPDANNDKSGGKSNSSKDGSNHDSNDGHSGNSGSGKSGSGGG